MPISIDGGGGAFKKKKKKKKGFNPLPDDKF